VHNPVTEKKYLRTSNRDCGTNSLRLCPRVAVLVLRAMKKIDASVSNIPKSILYTYIRSKHNQSNSSLSSPRVAKRFKSLQHVKRLEKRRCTDSIFSQVQQNVATTLT